MNLWLLVAAILSYVLGVGHSVFGEWSGDRILVRRIHQLQLFEAAEKDALAKRVVRLAWHATSIAWSGLGTFFLYLAFVELNDHLIVTVRIVSITFLATSFFALVTVPRKAWLFLAIAVAAWVGAW